MSFFRVFIVKLFMEIKYFRLIKTIAKEGNIANSSDKLFLTQSALSHQLKDLEEKLGFKVFNRQKSKWILTSEGKEFLNLANRVLQTIDEGFESIRQISETSKGTINIGTECYSFYHGLPEFIQRMGHLYPNITINLALNETKQPIAKLISGDIDIAILSTKPKQKELESIKLFKDELFVIINNEHRLNKKKCIQANDFQDNHLIIHSYPLDSVAVYNLLLKPKKITPTKITAIPFTEVTFEMVKANMGIACLPEWILKTIHIPDEIKIKKITANGLKRQHYIAIRKDDRLRKHIDDFVNNLIDEFSG